MARFHHNRPGRCEGCAKLLEDVHPSLGDFFWAAKLEFKMLHVAVGWRGEIAQNKAFESGASKLQWPKSAHNYVADGQPCSRAIDLFEIIHGNGVWNPRTMTEVWKWSQANGHKLRWGGSFKSFSDATHFELAGRI